eukprot:TRINITY_DN1808_c0_g1_i3.p2 TRINITY_DN1808_c0_g1~~TRINITY_DN1808_c0_g1_i3.p2  ORF type:complete len:267 (+),score=-25.91 TRINITY_DN1808_c0_g1_i3:104-904(+)
MYLRSLKKLLSTTISEFIVQQLFQECRQAPIKVNKIIKVKQIMEEEFAFNCSSFVTNVTTISSNKLQFPIDLHSSSRQDIEAVINFINQGAEIESLVIGNLKGQKFCIQIIYQLVRSTSQNPCKQVVYALRQASVCLCLKKTVIFIGYDCIGDVGAKEIALALYKNEALTVINLGMLFDQYYCYLYRREQYWLQRSKGNRTCITQKQDTDYAKPQYTLLLLFIGSNNIGNEGAKEIGLALYKNKALTILNLGSSVIVLFIYRIQQY